MKNDWSGPFTNEMLKHLATLVEIFQMVDQRLALLIACWRTLFCASYGHFVCKHCHAGLEGAATTRNFRGPRTEPWGQLSNGGDPFGFFS